MVCIGTRDCTAEVHVHGCYADSSGARCDTPDAHRAVAVDRTAEVARRLAEQGARGPEHDDTTGWEVSPAGVIYRGERAVGVLWESGRGDAPALRAALAAAPDTPGDDRCPGCKRRLRFCPCFAAGRATTGDTDPPCEAREVIAAFIAQEVGYEAPGMQEQAADLIAHLAAAGWHLERSAERLARRLYESSTAANLPPAVPGEPEDSPAEDSPQEETT